MPSHAHPLPADCFAIACRGHGMAQPMFITQMSHCLPLGSGRYHFFEFTSLSMALSSICSASSFFSRAFSGFLFFNHLNDLFV